MKHAIFLTAVLLAGCTQAAQSGIPVKVVYEEEEEKPVHAAVISAELYYVNEAGLLVPQTASVSAEGPPEEAALQALASEPPPGFRSPVPEGMMIHRVDVQDKTAFVHIGGNVTRYKPDEEETLAAAVTWTVTGFGRAEQVKWVINGEPVQHLPHGKPIPSDGFRRSDGINMQAGRAASGKTKPLTVYYYATGQTAPVLVPVTHRIAAHESNIAAAAVEELKKGPAIGSGLSTSWPADAVLAETPFVRQKTAYFELDEAILEETGTALVSSGLLKPLALTMAEAAGAAAISVQIKGHPDVKMETGDPLPVSLPVPFFANGEREE